MRFHYVARKVHGWALSLLVVPLVLVATTGALLQVKKHFAWIQPAERPGSTTRVELTPARILEICRTLPEARVVGWEDVARIDIRPSKGLVKVTSKSEWEVQLDAASGEVLSSALRRSDMIEALHDGSWFGDFAKYGLFLPAGAVLGFGAISGGYLFLLPWSRRSTRKKGSSLASSPL